MAVDSIFQSLWYDPAMGRTLDLPAASPDYTSIIVEWLTTITSSHTDCFYFNGSIILISCCLLKNHPMNVLRYGWECSDNMYLSAGNLGKWFHPFVGCTIDIKSYPFGRVLPCATVPTPHLLPHPLPCPSCDMNYDSDAIFRSASMWPQVTFINDYSLWHMIWGEGGRRRGEKERPRIGTDGM